MTTKNSTFVKDNNSELLFIIKYGSGDNLSEEDINSGYNAYMYYEVYEFNTDTGNLDEKDGGIMLYNDGEHPEYADNIKKAAKDVICFHFEIENASEMGTLTFIA